MICMFYTKSIGFIVLFENFRQGGGSHYNILFVLNLEWNLIKCIYDSRRHVCIWVMVLRWPLRHVCLLFKNSFFFQKQWANLHYSWHIYFKEHGHFQGKIIHNYQNCVGIFKTFKRNPTKNHYAGTTQCIWMK